MSVLQQSWRMEVCPRGAKYSHPDFGDLIVGIRPDGVEGWTFHERNGGGQVIIPFAFVGQKLFVGLLREMRELQGGLSLNVPRGFSNGAIPWVDALREQNEEVGFIHAPIRVHQLPGKYANPNSAFFETGEGEGVKFFAFRVSESELEEVEEIWEERPVFQIKRNLVLPVEEEKIIGLRFFKWQVAATVGDMFSNAAVARLLASVM